MKRPVDAIEGIGPVRRDRLAEIHIKTVGDLLSIGSTQAGRQEISEAVGVNQDMVLGWVRRADLMRVPETGSQYSDLLVASDVVSIFDLADRDAETLLARITGTNKADKRVRELPSLDEVTHWILQAKRLKQGLPLEARLDDTPATAEDDEDLFDKFDDFSLTRLSEEAPETTTAELIGFAVANEAAKMETPDVEVGSAEIETVEVADVSVETPDVTQVEVLDVPEFDLEVETPSLDTEVVDTFASIPELDLTPVDETIEIPDADVDVEVAVDTPEVTVDVPAVDADVDVDAASVDVDAPNVDVEVPNVDVDIDEPELELPEFGDAAPKKSKDGLSLETLETLAAQTSREELALDELHAPDLGADTGNLEAPSFDDLDDILAPKKKIKPTELVDDNPRFVAPEEPEPEETSEVVEQVLKQNAKKKRSGGIPALVMWLLVLGLAVIGLLFMILAYVFWPG